MSGDKLKSLKDMPAPPPSEAARAKALAAAMAAFDAAGKKVEVAPQGNGGARRLTHASTQTQRSRLMRANYFNYKIAASIAVLALAVPMSFYLYKQDMGSGAPVLLEPKPITAERTAAPVFPDGKPSVYDRLDPESGMQVVPLSGTSAQTANPVSGYTQAAPGSSSLDDRINEALKQAPKQGEKLAAAGPEANQPSPEGSAIWTSPLGPLRADFGMPTTKNNVVRFGASTKFGDVPGSSPVPSAPPPAATPAAEPASPPLAVLLKPTPFTGGQHSAWLEEQFDQTQVFRFGAAPKFDSEPARGNRMRGVYGGNQDIGGVSGDVNYTTEMQREPLPAEGKENRDQFEAFTSNVVKQVAAEPVSTFSIDVDTASYSNVRAPAQRRPPAAARRGARRGADQLLPLRLSAPRRRQRAVLNHRHGGALAVGQGHQLVHIGIKGYDIARAASARALNLVLLLDVSGSMDEPDKLPLLKQALPHAGRASCTARRHGRHRRLCRRRRRGARADRRRRNTRKHPRPRSTICTPAARPRAAKACASPIALAERNFDASAVNRVILATDGDFNVGITDPEQLQDFVERKRETGIYPVGARLRQRQLQRRADAGAGAERQRRRRLHRHARTKRATCWSTRSPSTLFPIANDVKIQVEFNPARVAEYRLIGYETRMLNREDFNNDKVDAGEIGSGHTVTAIYEIDAGRRAARSTTCAIRSRKAQRPPLRAPAANSRSCAFATNCPGGDIEAYHR